MSNIATQILPKTEKNNMHDVDTFMFFKWIFKVWVAVYLITHTLDITISSLLYKE